MINVFLIDDHPAILEGLDFMLSDSEEGVRMAGSSLNIKEAITSLPSMDVQVIMLDLFLRQDDPMENLRLLKMTLPDIPVIIYSAEDSIWWKQRMFNAGISAYLCKCLDQENIISTIVQVAAGNIVFPQDLLSVPQPDIKGSNKFFFTREEIEIGRDLSLGLTIKRMAAKHDKSPSSIEKALRVLRQKTGATTLPELVRIFLSQRLIPLTSDK